jgi:uncharacterized protein (DUF1697 family)
MFISFRRQFGAEGVPREMTVYVGLLRAVNMAGARPIGMEALRGLLEEEGLENVQTLLNSGNAVFRSRATSPSELEERLERALARGTGVSTEFFVRTASEWRAILDHNPFLREADVDPGHLLLAALKRAPGEKDWAALVAAIQGREKVRGSGRHAYLVYPDGVGRSKLTVALIERKLGTRSTSRNWNTVRKLDQLASS